MSAASPLGQPRFKASNQITGAPLAGGKLFSYINQTATPKNTYTDSTGTVANSNPVILNSAGEADIFLIGEYKIILQDASGNVQWTEDNISQQLDFGGVSEWIPSGLIPTYVSATQFTVQGDQTLVLPVTRRIKSVNTGGTTYSTVSIVSYAAGTTTVTVTNSSGVLDSGLSSFQVGMISSSTAATTSLPGGVGLGTVTNTGGALTSNAVVLGAGGNDSKAVAGITTDGTSQLNLGVAGVSTGILNLKSTATRITADMDNATVANRLFFQGTTVNGVSRISIMPNGSGTLSSWEAFDGNDPANASKVTLGISNATGFASINTATTGTGTKRPLTIGQDSQPLMIFDKNSTDTGGPANSGGAQVLYQPTVSHGHGAAIFLKPQFDFSATVNTDILLGWVTKWGDSGTPIPAGSKGNPSGFNFNSESNQAAADGNGIDGIVPFGATVVGHGGIPINPLAAAVTIDTVAANVQGVIIFLKKNVAGGTQYGFNANSGGSQVPTAAFKVTGTWTSALDANAMPIIGAHVVAPASDSTTAVQITKADASTAVVTVDTTNGRASMNGLVAVQNGFPTLIVVDAQTAKNAAFGPTTIFTAPAADGWYEVAQTISITTVGTSGTISIVVNWTDADTNVASSSAASTTGQVSSLGGWAGGVRIIHVKASTAVTITVTYNTVIGTPVFNAYTLLKKL